MKKQVYKVDDRVKILSSLCGDNHVGKIGKITKQMFYSKSGKVISREIKVGKETCSYATEIKLLPPLKPKKSIKKMETIKGSFVLSSSEFADVKSAERKVQNWYQTDKLADKSVKLYKVVEVYDLKMKFVKRSPNHQ